MRAASRTGKQGQGRRLQCWAALPPSRPPQAAGATINWASHRVYSQKFFRCTLLQCRLMIHECHALIAMQASLHGTLSSRGSKSSLLCMIVVFCILNVRGTMLQLCVYVVSMISLLTIDDCWCVGDIPSPCALHLPHRNSVTPLQNEPASAMHIRCRYTCIAHW